jgi:sec-independent protein translocase protein TatA
MNLLLAVGMHSLPLFAMGIGPMELFIVAGVVLLLFGGRLPGAMRNLGRSVVEFKKGVKEIDDHSDAGASAETTVKR